MAVHIEIQSNLNNAKEVEPASEAQQEKSNAIEQEATNDLTEAVASGDNTTL